MGDEISLSENTISMRNFLKGNLANIFKYATVIGVIVFISFLFPSANEFSFRYQEGQTWLYSDLVADYNFPVLKRDDLIASERQSVKDNFIPFYDYNSSRGDSVRIAFGNDFDELISQLQLRGEQSPLLKQPDKYKKYADNLLKDLYSGYIVEEVKSEQESQDTELIRLVDKSDTKTISRTDLKTIKKVQGEMTRALSISALEDSDFLIPILNDVLKANTSFNAERTERILTAKLDDISTLHGVVEKGETIVSENQVISSDVYQKIISYEKEYINRNIGERKNLFVFLGLLLLTTLIVGVFLLFLQFNARPVYKKYSSLLFMLIWLVIYSYLVSVIESIDALSVYMIPFCIVPIVVINFFSDRIALFIHIVIILLASLLSKEGHEFTFLQIFVGIVTVLTFKPSRYWLKFFYSIFFIFLAYIFGHLGLSLIRVGSFIEIDWTPFVWLFIASFLTLLAFPLVPLVERIFGFTSSITLSELSDINRPLLKRLTTEAPGTFQHSLQVSNLAENAAEAIGADALQVKVGALYHDIGKLKNPQYFVENQNSFDNPHTDLNAKESAEIILNHVSDGVEMAKKYRLPSVLVDFIKTHHGTTRVEYFYREFQDANPDIQVDPKVFTYSGPRPQTKEQAILMIADSLEAASKSLKSPTEKDINRLVDTIIDGKIQHQQFSESDLTFKDLDTCRALFKKMLKSIYHIRIEYPD